MSLAIVRNVLSKVPVPLAGNAVTAVGFAAQKSKAIPRYAPWALPLAAGGAWFIWPAVTDNFKITLGLLPDPELEAAEAEAAAAEAASAPAAAVAADDDDDDEDEDEAPAAAPKVDMAAVLAQEAKGDFSHLEQKWETDMKELVNGDDLDDEDDDDDDDEDDE